MKKEELKFGPRKIIAIAGDPAKFIVSHEQLIQIKRLKHLEMFFLESNGSIIIKNDRGEKITLSKSEIFPVLRGLVSATQRFYRRKEVKK